MNDKGVVVGSAGEGDAARAARWDNDQLTELGSLGGASGATSINNAGVIVGWSKDADGDLHGVIFRNNKPVDLNTLIDRNVVFKDSWVVQSVSGINDKGEICGYAVKNGGPAHAVILKPATHTISVATLEEIASAIRNAKPQRTLLSRDALRL